MDDIKEGMLASAKAAEAAARIGERLFCQNTQSVMNFKSQICTTREQSERLIALGLKKETADMVYEPFAETSILLEDSMWDVNCDLIIPAWSLHRLLLLIPKEVNIDGYRFPLRSDAVMRLDEADDMYEYIIGVLERTIKEGYFNKEYMED